jgi:cytochrome c-type biogenesis protein CcmH
MVRLRALTRTPVGLADRFRSAAGRRRVDHRFVVLLLPLAVVGIFGILPTMAAAAMAAEHAAAAETHDHHELHALAAETDGGYDVREVTDHLMCTCGCALTIYACEMAMTCTISPRMREDAEELLAAGLTPKEALAVFEADHGERILASPTRRGFNLTAWLVPLGGVLAGLGFVVVAVRGWRQADTPRDPEELPSAVGAYVDVLEREIEEGL